MAAPESTKFQVNYKLPDGTLVNLYATDVKDLETGLTDLSMVATLIKSTSSELSGGSAVSTPTEFQKAVDDRYNPPANGATKTCAHGAMNYREGVGTKGPWKGWMCAAPKGTPNQCQPIFVK